MTVGRYGVRRELLEEVGEVEVAGCPTHVTSPVPLEHYRQLPQGEYDVEAQSRKGAAHARGVPLR
jgi:hypothetical protein